MDVTGTRVQGRRRERTLEYLVIVEIQRMHALRVAHGCSFFWIVLHPSWGFHNNSFKLLIFSRVLAVLSLLRGGELDKVVAAKALEPESSYDC